LGPIAFKSKEEYIFIGKEIARQEEISEEVAKRLDEEIMKIIHSCYEKAKSILNKNLDKLHNLAKALFEKETLNANEIDDIISSSNGKKDFSPAVPEPV